MTIDEYAAWATRLDKASSATSLEAQELFYLGLGLAGETGEVVEHLKKFLRDGVWLPERVADELGDVAYDWARLCLATGHHPSDILQKSVQKIEAKAQQNSN